MADCRQRYGPDGASEAEVEAAGYPAPTMVVGVGDLGLAVVERLAEDWSTLERCGGGPAARNLRLLHVHRREEDGDDAWRVHDLRSATLARHVGEDDLPSLALDFVVLRSLGLIRYRDGCYQVALPKDAGAVEGERAPAADLAAGEGDGEGAPPRVVRRRYFEWLPLFPDPVVAVERLYRLASHSTELDLFITPLLNRFRQGHSPRALLACIARCQALATGKDPSPWPWIRRLTAEGEPGSDGRGPAVVEGDSEASCARLFTTRDGLAELDDPDELAKLVRKVRRLYGDAYQPAPLEGHAPPPVGVRQWAGWLESFATEGAAAEGDGTGGGREAATTGGQRGVLRLRVPRPFVPRRQDLETPIDPRSLLAHDWQSAGWATAESESLSTKPFQLTADATPFRLGLFDHDETARSAAVAEKLRPRLAELALLTEKGLIRLWDDLQRSRVEEGEAPSGAERHRASGDDALRQVLELLGRVMVEPVVVPAAKAAGERQAGAPDTVPRARSPRRAALSTRNLSVSVMPRESPTVHRLEARLEALGLGRAEGAATVIPLLREIGLAPPRWTDSDRDPAAAAPVPDGDEPTPDDNEDGLVDLRRTLNRQAAELLDFGYLTEVRQRPVRQPPRVSVFVVGDLGEPFVRASLRPLLREVHRELLRSFSPIFEQFRQGFDRSLSVIPILWMPHPADPHAGDRQDERPAEQAAIIDAVQGVRRWVEAVIPDERRRVFQIFVNSRVTEMAVLADTDAVRQTRDFITLLSRNPVHRDPWLRKVAVGEGGPDVFSSFACYEAEFPAEKAREYLANRLLRQVLTSLADDSIPVVGGTLSPGDLAPPTPEPALREPTRRLEQVTEEIADRAEAQVEGATGEIVPAATSRELRRRYDEAFERRLEASIQEAWGRLSQSGGGMDEMVERLRGTTSQALPRTLARVRRESDRLVEQLAIEHGLAAALAGFEDLRGRSRRRLEDQEAARRAQEALCVRHRIPDFAALRGARAALVAAIDAKPDRDPMRVGLLLWAAMAPALGAALLQSLAYWLELHRDPDLLEVLLGPAAAATGGLLLAAAGWLYLRRRMRLALERVRRAVAYLAESARRVVAGAGGEPQDEAPSIRSFFATRLRLTAVLAGRAFAGAVHRRVEADRALGDRIGRSVDTQQHILWRRAEDLGARPRMAAVGGDEDVSALFASPYDDGRDVLLRPATLLALYHFRLTDEGEVRSALAELLDRLGGFGDWRRSAPLSATEELLGFGRGKFSHLIERSLHEQDRFADEVGERLVDFVARYYANLGFGANFLGSEGLDPDGVALAAEAALVLHPALQRLFAAARTSAGRRTTKTLRTVTAEVRPNAVYMLSLAQGIRPHTIRNLRRFESFHARSAIPEDRTFPLSGDVPRPGSVDHLTAYEEGLVKPLHAALAEARRRSRPAPVASGDDA